MTVSLVVADKSGETRLCASCWRDPT
jgi:hypothetical protein